MKIAKNVCAAVGIIGFLLMFGFAGDPAPDSTLTLAQQVGGIFIGLFAMLAGYLGYHVCDRINYVRRDK